jgi:hypothetical protein
MPPEAEMTPSGMAAYKSWKEQKFPVDWNLVAQVAIAAAPSLEQQTPVAQRLEPAAHNGLVAGSSPAGRTNIGDVGGDVTREEIRDILTSHLNADWDVDGIGRVGAFITDLSLERTADHLFRLLHVQKEG